MLDVAGRSADRALLWAVPVSDLERSAAVISAGVQAGREAYGLRPEVVWAPLVDHGGESRRRVQTIAAYSVLNSRPEVQMRWGVDRSTVDRLREVLVGGGAAAAQGFVPAVALEDLILHDPSPTRVGVLARKLGAASLAVPAFSIDEVGQRVAWAREVLA
jgi:hypothetical protein